MIFVVGGMNRDILAVPQGEYIPEDSNIGTVQFQTGGVGRNIAARIAETGEKVALITALGNDRIAEELKEDCRTRQISLEYALQTGLPSPVYVAVHDQTGNMTAAVNDMRAMECLTPERMKPLLPAVNHASCCVLDANLSLDALEYLAENVSCPLVLDPVSCEKSKRCNDILHRIYAAKPNLQEALFMTGRHSAEDAARSLLDKGVKQVYISLGKGGLLYASQDETGRLFPEELLTVPQTGAGDALCAGIVTALSGGEGIRECAVSGMRTAERYLKSKLEGSAI